jgi:hypothetical protein
VRGARRALRPQPSAAGASRALCDDAPPPHTDACDLRGPRRGGQGRRDQEDHRAAKPPRPARRRARGADRHREDPVVGGAKGGESRRPRAGFSGRCGRRAGAARRGGGRRRRAPPTPASAQAALNPQPPPGATAHTPSPPPPQRYFQRYVQHLPSGGEIVLFDRSWYNRAGEGWRRGAGAGGGGGGGGGEGGEGASSGHGHGPGAAGTGRAAAARTSDVRCPPSLPGPASSSHPQHPPPRRGARHEVLHRGRRGGVLPVGGAFWGRARRGKCLGLAAASPSASGGLPFSSRRQAAADWFPFPHPPAPGPCPSLKRCSSVRASSSSSIGSGGPPPVIRTHAGRTRARRRPPGPAGRAPQPAGRREPSPPPRPPSVSDDEQERRFQDRIDTPAKRWKLSPFDLTARSKWGRAPARAHGGGGGGAQPAGWARRWRAPPNQPPRRRLHRLPSPIVSPCQVGGLRQGQGRHVQVRGGGGRGYGVGRGRADGGGRSGSLQRLSVAEACPPHPPAGTPTPSPAPGGWCPRTTRRRRT